jgi:hypothetical protein
MKATHDGVTHDTYTEKRYPAGISRLLGGRNRQRQEYRPMCTACGPLTAWSYNVRAVQQVAAQHVISEAYDAVHEQHSQEGR